MNLRVLVAALVGIALGIAAAYLYRSWTAPSVAERARDAASDLRRGAQRALEASPRK